MKKSNQQLIMKFLR